jgi:glycerol-3-phosphate dehydrogenase (NAD(P)+)
MKIAILGAGAWGTALAIGFSRHHSVALWVRDPDQFREMASTRINRRHLDGVFLPECLHVTSDPGDALDGADLVLVAVPMSGMRQVFRMIAGSGRRIPVIWVSKGFEAGTAKFPHQVALEEYDKIAPIGALSGPSFAMEVARGLPVALTLASSDPDFASKTASALHSQAIRVYSSTDLIGVEVGGAVKNVMAIAAGVADGLHLGANTRATLITRGLAEIMRLGLALGGHRETLMGLAGLGDLVLTCTDDQSRNRRLGLALGQGRSAAQAQ